MGSVSEKGRLKVGIIGAGVAGLGAAIALRQAGHDVEMYEQSEFKYEIGAAITFTPNGGHVLQHWGIDPALGRPVISRGYELVSGDKLATQILRPLDDMDQQYGFPVLNFHRVDLHDLLRNAATGSDRQGEPAKINLGCKVASVDCQEGLIVLEDGQAFTKDLVVIADGVKTQFVPAITGLDIPLSTNGRSVIRGLAPFSAINAHPELGPYYAKRPLKPCYWIPHDHHKTSVVTYPCGGHELLNIALLHETSPTQKDKGTWTTPASFEDCLEVTQNFHPMVHDLLKMSTDTKIHMFYTRGPLPTLANGKAVIIGDAAGPHLPQHAQGGTVSLECAAALGLLFSNVFSPTGKAIGEGGDAVDLGQAVRTRTSMFNEAMRYRVALTQLMSYCIPFNPENEYMAKSRKQLETLWAEEGIECPPADYPPFGPDVTEVLYRHNIINKTKKLMKQRGLETPA